MSEEKVQRYLQSLDWEDIKFGVENKVDFYAVSFVKDAQVVHELKNYLKDRRCMRRVHQGIKLMRMFMKELFLLIFLIVRIPFGLRFLATLLNKRGKRRLGSGRSLCQRWLYMDRCVRVFDWSSSLAFSESEFMDPLCSFVFLVSSVL